MQGTGNINYSFNKNNFVKIITTTLFAFVPFYFIVVLLSFIYLYSIRFQSYYYPERNNNYKINEKLIHFFKSITIGSPFNILELEEYNKDDKKLIGLSGESYLKLIIAYVITLIIIIDSLVRNLLYSIYSNFIQINLNNNPYKNQNCILKINQSPNISISANYVAISSLSFVFIIPFIIPFLIYYMKFDNYDIKHSSWFKYVILFLIFYPFIILFLTRTSLKKKLDILPDLKKFLDTNDYNFVDKITNNYIFNMSSNIIFIIIIFIFCYYTLIYSEFKYDTKNKFFIYTIIILILFIFIPLFFMFFILSLTLNNKNIQSDKEYKIIKNIQKNGLNGLYDLIVKYNYPCFVKKK